MAAMNSVLNFLCYHHLISQDKVHSNCQLLLDIHEPLHGHTPLLLPQNNTDNCCSNANNRPDLWLTNPAANIPSTFRTVGFLTQLGHVCIAAKLCKCDHEACLDTRRMMYRSAPSCEWRPFRDWALTAMSCREGLARDCNSKSGSKDGQVDFLSMERSARVHTHIISAVHACYTILDASRANGGKRMMQSTGDGFMGPVIDVQSVCNLIYWMLSILACHNLEPAAMGRWDGYYIPRSVTVPAIHEAARRISNLSLCSCRFWNLVNVAERKQNDLPDLIHSLEHVGRREALKHQEEHFGCAPNRCQTAHMDSTRVHQMHKCSMSGNDCKQAKYPVQELIARVELGEGTAWSRDKEELSAADAPYIAISHVWSDGTGVGMSDQGLVNSCLFQYFARIAERLKCKGIWWDALSLPLEPRTRSKAINQMHKNYADAEYTVIHDSYLLNIKAYDAETACLAIVLSPWFTRGWTALELRMATQVKVLFKGENEQTPAIMDLETDILASSPNVVSRAHWLASKVIRRLRSQAVEFVDDIMAVLGPRQTSRVRDRTIIAGLLTGMPQCNYSQSESEITKSILFYLGFVPHESLLHGRPTMCEKGPFSWSPATLDEMPITARIDSDSPELRRKRMLKIQDGGAVVGRWHCQTVTEHQVQNNLIEPHGDHVSVAVPFYSALLQWTSCLILRERKGDRGPAVLVMTVPTDTEHRERYLDCRYVGAARIAEENDEYGDYDGIRRQEDLVSSCDATVRIGADKDKHVCCARDAIEPWIDKATQEGLRESFKKQKKSLVEQVVNEGCPGQEQDESDHSQFTRPGRRVDACPQQEYEGSVHDASPADEALGEELVLEAFKTPKAPQILQLFLTQGVDITNEIKHKLEFRELSLLASVYFANNRPDDARQTCALAYEQLPSGGIAQAIDPATVEAMCELGRTCWKTGLLNEGQCAYSGCISYLTEADDDMGKRRLRLQALGELSFLHSEIGMMNEATSCYLGALKIIDSSLNVPNDVYVFSHDALTRLGDLCSHKDAEDQRLKTLYSKVLRDFERELGKEHAATLITAQNLAAVLYAQGEIAEAEEVLKEVIRAMKKMLDGRQHLLLLRARYDLMRIHILQGKRATPQKLEAFAQICANNLPSGHWLVREVRLAGGRLYERQGELGKAIHSLAQLIGSPPPNNAETSSVYLHACTERDLGIFYLMSDNTQSAERHLKAARMQLEGIRLDNHLDVHVADLCLAVLQNDKLQNDKLILERDSQQLRDTAAKLFRKPISGIERICGPTYPETRELVSLMARLCEARVRKESSDRVGIPVIQAMYHLSELLCRYGDDAASQGRVKRTIPYYDEFYGPEKPSKGQAFYRVEELELPREDDEVIIENATVSLHQYGSRETNSTDDDSSDTEDESDSEYTPQNLTIYDLAGTVRKLGGEEHTQGLQEGDRVLALAVYPFTKEDRHKGFRNYTVVPASLVAVIPPSLSFYDAAALPLGIVTAAVALFQRLKVPITSLSAGSKSRRRKGTGTVIVWGGTTSPGCNAIQLAAAAGCTVIATAPGKEFDYVRRLGASEVVDKYSPRAKEDLLEILKKMEHTRLLGAIDTEDTDISTAICKAVVGNSDLVAPASDSRPPDAISFKDTVICRNIFKEFLPKALSEKSYVVAPSPVSPPKISHLRSTVERAQKKVITPVYCP
ncbi:uncharacterized protein BO88DRAFT_460041 [Aspergillus vadensis CBS 113365]|uniref:Enoyl reductase (ER) domain-containing protein n=1 Tax=Aspergillus vadensis (strain CBS 113365 / IMI 142717 / IBT 24658) TaxID=1448311 RepID=A0A319BSP8_ASPVC|nr:hypothetical protein BO88DRAFT_460041 [Aspergillus vadensis CBS 113365]PYH74499.1 hypothetical protein BO88DRAFT_460041 [Aspergillus vadensis CBS 113365]